MEVFLHEYDVLSPVFIIELPEWIEGLWLPDDVRPERAVAPLERAVRVVEVRAGDVGKELVAIPEGKVTESLEIPSRLKEFCLTWMRAGLGIV